MKNMKILLLASLIALPKTVFGIVGFGLNVIQDGSKLGASSYTEGSGITLATVESFEMDAPPAGMGGYIFINLAGWAVELEGNAAYGEYSFTFSNAVTQMEDIPFGWARVSSGITVKKNIADFSIPFLAKTALSVGVGVNSHSSTPRASVSMVKELLSTDDLAAEFDASSLEDELIDYLKDNKIDNSGVHLQLGLRFKILVIDSHLNFRYNMTKDVYEGENGFTEIQFKLGMGF